MDAKERYLKDVLQNIQAPPKEMKRIESDLGNHLQDLQDELGEDFSQAAVIERMGSPEEVAAGFMANIKLHYAGFPERATAFLIDMAACVSVAALLGLPALILSGFSPSDLAGPALLLAIPAFSMIIAAAGVMILYFPILEGRFGTTLGKHLLNLHVARDCGAPIGYKEAFLRRIPYYFEFLFIDMLFIFFTEKKQRAFDLIAKTVVVKNV